MVANYLVPSHRHDWLGFFWATSCVAQGLMPCTPGLSCGALRTACPAHVFITEDPICSSSWPDGPWAPL